MCDPEWLRCACFQETLTGRRRGTSAPGPGRQAWAPAPLPRPLSRPQDRRLEAAGSAISAGAAARAAQMAPTHEKVGRSQRGDPCLAAPGGFASPSWEEPGLPGHRTFHCVWESRQGVPPAGAGVSLRKGCRPCWRQERCQLSMDSTYQHASHCPSLARKDVACGSQRPFSPGSQWRPTRPRSRRGRRC